MQSLNEMHKLLIVYCEEGHTLKLENVLLQYPSLLNLKTSHGYTLLSHAVKASQPDVCQFLLQLGAEPNTINNSGQTPLFISISNCCLETATILLQNGADPNIVDKNGWSPLHVVALKGKIELAKLLLSYKANALLCDKSGKTPLNRAKNQEMHDYIDNYLNQEQETSNAYVTFFNQLFTNSKPILPNQIKDEICVQLNNVLNEIHSYFNSKANSIDLDQAITVVDNLHSELNKVVATVLTKYKVKYNPKYLLQPEDIDNIRCEFMSRFNSSSNSQPMSARTQKYHWQYKKQLGAVENQLKIKSEHEILSIVENVKNTIKSQLINDVKASLALANDSIIKNLDNKTNHKLQLLAVSIRAINNEQLQGQISNELQHLQNIKL